jgi:hypothetical protein
MASYRTIEVKIKFCSDFSESQEPNTGKLQRCTIMNIADVIIFGCGSLVV